MRPLKIKDLALLAFALTAVPPAAQAQMQDRLCDTELEDCRAPLLNLIYNERQGIDVAFWFMTDARYTNALVKKFQEGVPVRVIMDERANVSKPKNTTYLQQLRDAGLPMRQKNSGGILHWKMMLFHGQNVVEFSKANYSPESFVATQPGVGWFDEAVFFTRDNRVTNTFRTMFDNLWVNTSNFANYANVTTPLVRRYSVYPMVEWLNFPPSQNFATRAISRYNAEPTQIDAFVYRVTDNRHADAMIAALKRGVRVRVITELHEYRDPKKLEHAYNLDRMYMAGVEMKKRQHSGLMHELGVVLHGLGEAIFGSSNMSPTSANFQHEHNLFYSPGVNIVLDSGETFFQWFADQFERKWNNTTAFVPFQPLLPTNPVYSAPSNGATGLSTNVTLRWDGGNWAYLYDIYFGTSPTPPLLVKDVALGSPQTGVLESYTVQNLVPGTTYYWRIVGKTMAQKASSGATRSFTTAGGVGTGSSAFGGTPVTLPGTISVVNFDEGGSGVAYYDTTAGNTGNVYRSTNVDIGQVSSGYYVGWTRAGEWLKYTVSVGTTGTYTLETLVANQGTGAKFRVEVDGVDKTGALAVPNTGGWDTWQTVPGPGISLSAGQHVVRLVFLTANTGASGVGNYRSLRFTQGGSTSAQSTPFPNGTPAALPGTVLAVNFDNGASGVAYYDNTSGNSGGLYRSTNVDIGQFAIGYYVGWTRPGEWLKYTVSVGTTGTYTLETLVANQGTGATFRVEVDGVDRTGPVSVPDTGGWDAWSWRTVPSPISLSAGQHVVRLVFVTANTGASGVGNYRSLRFTQ
jgi:HKD family nuclease